MTQLRDANVVITGGASGIGRRMAHEMAGRGASVAIWDLDELKAKQTAEELSRPSSERHAGYGVDVTDRAGVFEVAERTTAELGPIDVLINNAGVVSGRWLTELTEAQIRRTFDVNTLALYWTTQAVLPGMIERDRGHIATIASASAFVGVAKLSDYAPSKWAAYGFNESLRMELRRQKSAVRTTVVCPYYINTGLFAGAKSRFSRLLPILQEDDVAAKTVQAIERDKPRLYMPATVGVGHVLRFLPVSWFDRFNDFLGSNRSMDDFTGRSTAD